MKYCERPDCKKEFIPIRSDQKYCSKQCRELEGSRRFYKRWPGRRVATSINCTRNSSYGLTRAQFDQLAQQQNFVCAICKGPPTGGRKELSVDHCHTTKKIRGLLCNNCNAAIGLLKDDIDLLIKAKEYLMALKS